MDALLLIDHGSRFESANKMIYEVAEMVASLNSEIIIEVAHMELAEPSIETGFRACVEKGATHVVAHPYMLAPGRHATQDIPRLVNQAAQLFPEVSFDVTEPLGVNTKIGEVILEKAGLD